MPTTIHFCPYIRILSHDPVPLTEPKDQKIRVLCTSAASRQNTMEMGLYV
jgi:hypothetical protein